MNYIRQLAGQTLIYGMGIVIPRLLNYALLTPFYTRVFNTSEYGIITELYAYVVFLMVILTYGMETGYFRYADNKYNKENVYRSAIVSLALSTVTFILLIIIFSGQIAKAIDYGNHPEYIVYIGIIVGIDAFTSIPFARLRLENKAFKYSMIRIGEIIINLSANWFFLFFSPRNEGSDIIKSIYNPEIGVGYVFISNLISCVFKMIFLTKEIFGYFGKFEMIILKKMLYYSLPLLIAGLAGTVNEALDRILLKHMTPALYNPMEQLGIYGANYKFAVLMTLFIQMFRYAAEPFFFSKKEDKNARFIYAVVMKYFVFFGMLIFLFVMFFIDKLILLIGKDFREGMAVVPLILLANLLMGILYNLSIWYKLTNKTIFGAYLVMIGAVITILINVIFIPKYSYYASAWAHLISYSVMVVISFVFGQKFYKIPYEIKRIILFIFSGFFLYLIYIQLPENNLLLRYILGVLFITIYCMLFYLVELKKALFKKTLI